VGGGRFLDLGDSQAFDPDPSYQAITGERGICLDTRYEMQTSQ
jgi:hypothetical protein